MGAKITHVPYRGAGPAMQDLIAGRLDYMAEQISTALPQIQGGTVKAFATLGLDRAPGLENLPTADELGMKGLDCGAWGAFSFPKGTPQAIVQTPRQGVERRHRHAGGARALQDASASSSPRRTAARRNTSTKFVQSRDRALGGADQGERRQHRMRTTAEHRTMQGDDR